MTSLAKFIASNRPRIALVALLVGGVGLTWQLLPDLPRDVEIDLALGPDHDQVVAVSLTYLRGPEEIRGVTFHFPRGAPSVVNSRVELPSGLYRLAIERRFRNDTFKSVSRAFGVPAGGRVRVQAY